MSTGRRPKPTEPENDVVGDDLRRMITATRECRAGAEALPPSPLKLWMLDHADELDRNVAERLREPVE